MSKSQQSGFTLVELLVVMGIMALIMRIALPNVTQMMANFKSNATVNSLISDLNLAKTESIKSGQPVLVLCVGTPCANTPVDWSGGWQICYSVTQTNPDTCNIGSLTRLVNPIRTAGALGSGQKITAGGKALYFYPTGYANTVATFNASASGVASNNRTISVAMSGSINTNLDRR